MVVMLGLVDDCGILIQYGESWVMLLEIFVDEGVGGWG